MIIDGIPVKHIDRQYGGDKLFHFYTDDCMDGGIHTLVAGDSFEDAYENYLVNERFVRTNEVTDATELEDFHNSMAAGQNHAAMELNADGIVVYTEHVRMRRTRWSGDE